MADTTWQDSKLCSVSSVDDDLWFSDDETQRAIARETCNRCPVKDDCLNHALINKFEYGIYGGMGEEERKRLQEAIPENTPEYARLQKKHLVILPEQSYPTPSVEAKYTRRAERAEYCYQELTKMDPDDVPHYDMFADALRAVLRSPTSTGAELGKSLGKSTAMFNQRLRECFEFFELDLSLL